MEQAIERKDADQLAQLILSGNLTLVKQFPIDTFADIVNDRLKRSPEATTTLVLYAFMLSASQPKDSIESAEKAISNTDSKSEPLLSSQLYTFKGWLQSVVSVQTNDSLDPALASFKTALVDSASPCLAAPFLYCHTLVAAMQQQDKKGDLEFAKSVILAINEYLVGDECSVSGKDRILGYLLLAEAMFRKGPRGGTTLAELKTEMERCVERADELATSTEAADDPREPTSEANAFAISEQRDRVSVMLQRVRELVLKSS